MCLKKHFLLEASLPFLPATFPLPPRPPRLVGLLHRVLGPRGATPPSELLPGLVVVLWWVSGCIPPGPVWAVLRAEWGGQSAVHLGSRQWALPRGAGLRGMFGPFHPCQPRSPSGRRLQVWLPLCSGSAGVLESWTAGPWTPSLSEDLHMEAEEPRDAEGVCV